MNLDYIQLQNWRISLILSISISRLLFLTIPTWDELRFIRYYSFVKLVNKPHWSLSNPQTALGKSTSVLRYEVIYPPHPYKMERKTWSDLFEPKNRTSQITCDKKRRYGIRKKRERITTSLNHGLEHSVGSIFQNCCLQLILYYYSNAIFTMADTCTAGEAYYPHDNANLSS